MGRKLFQLTEKGKRLLEPGTFQMFRYLWGRVPLDCRWDLVFEFMVSPEALRERYREEVKFQQILKKGFRDNAPSC